ncbi:sulfotransferase domain-containing protein [Methylomagnum sp.]
MIGPGCHALAGLAHASAGHYDRAIMHFEAALAQGRFSHASLHHHLGLAHLRRGDPAPAEPNFRLAVRLAPEAHWPYWGLGECLLAEDCLAEAEKVLRTALALAPDCRGARHALFHCLLRQNRADEAVDAIIQAAATASPEILASIPFPWDLLTAPLATEARAQALRVIVERQPTAAEAIIFLAWMETLLGRHDAAQNLFRQAAAQHWLRRHGPAWTTGAEEIPSKPPQFLMIGQAKAGTTALYKSLCAHPRIGPPLLKEPQFWSEHYGAGEAWYRALFPPTPLGAAKITGEASTTYFTHPEAPGRIAQAMPTGKLILLLRDPVARAYSEYRMYVRLGWESRTWEDIVATDLESLPACPLDFDAPDTDAPPNSILTRSAALPHLKRWLCYFPREQLLILRSSELAEDMPGTLGRVFAFLGLPPFVPEDAKRENEGRYPPMVPETEQRLRDWFAPHQQALESFLAIHHSETP